MLHLELPYLTGDLAGIGGSLKQSPEDFEVEEVPTYEPCGEGEHLFLWVEKRDVAAEELVRQLARGLGVSREEVGTAGLKDRRAVTRQFVSVPARCEGRVAEFEGGGIRVLRAERHGNKLRTGHLKGNRFSILVRDVAQEALPVAQAVAARVVALGFPNYFGEQRFGFEGETATLGLDLLCGRKSPRDLPGSRRKFLLRLALSAIQSSLFNQALAERLTDGLLHRVLPGDVMQVTASGGKFIVEDSDVEQRRFEARETVITGPMFGPKMHVPTGEPAERERRLLERLGLSAESFRTFKSLTPGTRRPYVVWPEEFSVEEEPNGIRFRFTLPSGVYATALLREFQKGADADERDARID